MIYSIYSAVKGISNYIIHTVQVDFKLNKKKPINIMDDKENAIAEEENFEE